MSKKNITINGERFELIKSNNVVLGNEPIGCVRQEIFDCYARPSDIKRSIWGSWCDWCDAINRNGGQCSISISGHNCMQFSISGWVEIDNETYAIWITREHNRAYKAK